jgi:peptidoglycan/xylan/chitin deacetylase (PgdA/CDA1 family)
MVNTYLSLHPQNIKQAYQNDDPDWTSKFPGLIFYHGSTDYKFAALTFDDAPDSLFLPIILNILAEENVKATFFCLGNCVANNPDSLIGLTEQGHIIGNHTYDHIDITKASPEKIMEEILETEDEIEQLTGLRTALFRPPYGFLNNNNIQLIVSMGYRIIMWTIDSYDWMGLTGPMITSRILTGITPGAISLMHNACGGSVQAGTGTSQSLPFIIKTLKAEGYTFTTIPNLLNIPAYQ